jgi:REP element-mobilizing transposase RayT
LHGDPRGFRSRDHRLHSNGDYKRPPPEGEHARLHRWQIERSKQEIVLTAQQRETVGQAVLAKLTEQNHDVLVIAAGSTHVHVLAQLPDDWDKVKLLMGLWKQASSHALRSDLPGRVWSVGGPPKRVRDQTHQRKVVKYLRKHVEEDAWVWDWKHGVLHTPSSS